jgi:Protein of unknown function (DUF3179)
MPRRPINWIRVFLIAVPVAVAGALLVPYAVAVFQSPMKYSAEPSSPVPMLATPFFAPGIDCPPTVAATVADLRDDEEVIGVVVKGRPRAYLVKAFAGMGSHVVNDLIDAVPVTVTFCNVRDTAQVFTGPKRGEPLDIWTGGFNDGLFLRTGGTAFWQSTGKMIDSERKDEMPFPTYPFDRAPWKVWKDVHPMTDLYLGPQ